MKKIKIETEFLKNCTMFGIAWNDGREDKSLGIVFLFIIIRFYFK